MDTLTSFLLSGKIGNPKNSKRINNSVRMRNLSEQKINDIINHIEDLCYNQCYSKHMEEQTAGEPFIKRNIPPSNPVVISKTNLDLIYNLTLSLFNKVYGTDNEHVGNFQSQFSDFNFNQNTLAYDDILSICLAKLEFIKVEIKLGLISSIENEVIGEIVADFLSLARKSLTEDSIAVSAVLSCASLEDTLKRYASLNELNVENKTMSEVVNALKSKSLISSTQNTILKGYTQVRNSAFHADWNKIEKSDISSIIGFTEEFILKHFNGHTI